MMTGATGALCCAVLCAMLQRHEERIMTTGATGALHCAALPLRSAHQPPLHVTPWRRRDKSVAHLLLLLLAMLEAAPPVASERVVHSKRGQSQIAPGLTSAVSCLHSKPQTRKCSSKRAPTCHMTQTLGRQAACCAMLCIACCLLPALACSADTQHVLPIMRVLLNWVRLVP